MTSVGCKRVGVPGGAAKAKAEPTLEDIRKSQLDRLKLAGIALPKMELEKYYEMPDDLDIIDDAKSIPEGFKRCGRCKHVKKLYMFNKNSGNKLNATGNCKECQREAAAKSYSKTKKKRNYKKYYEENKERKQEQARKYYERNKEQMDAKHAEYLKSRAGRKVMKRAHSKRAKLIAKNKGVPYTRNLVIDRDREGGKDPICWLCGEVITDISGDALHLDHVVSLNNGGLDCFTNIACSHKVCNLKKTKDDREIDPLKVTEIIKRAEAYMDKHPSDFTDKE